MERKIQQNGLINLLALFAVGIAAYAVSRYGNSLAGAVGTVFLGLGVLVAGVSWFQMRLEERERLEKLEFYELSKSAAESTLFNAQEAEVFPAQRSREQFERFFVPAFTVLLFLLQTGFAVLLWRWLQKSAVATELQSNTPLVPLAFFAVFFLALFILGKYASSIARLEGHRLLRPGASYLLLTAYLCVVVAISIALVWGGFPKADLYVARALCGVLLFVGIETLINLILEIYRPRVRGKVERPVYESRLVSLLGQPEGLVTTAAQTLDYQFGFKVSETWAYRLAAEWLPRVVLLQLGALILSTMVVFIEPGEQALLERFGRPVAGRTVLGPGAHLKLPWPVDRVYRFATEQIQSFNVGFTPDTNEVVRKTILWTVAHAKEENFLVANRDTGLAITNNAGERPPPPVSLLSVSVPVQFQITNLTAWAYTNEDPAGLLQHIATREVVRYFVSVDLGEVMSRGRSEAADILRDRIQAEADRHYLGAKIVFVGLQDIHPPVKVAPDYEKVIAAIHTREADILAAKADAIKTNALAGARAFKIRSEAGAERARLETEALARAALFTNQIPAYEASPSVYTRRAYLDTFARAVGGARKYILLTTNTQNIAILDLEDKIRPDLTEEINIPAPQGK
jgi:regulator of protease activity HflC (stomatin/prohibitin superfamily)